MGYIAATIASELVKTAEDNSLAPRRKKKNWLPWLALGGLLLGGGALANRTYGNWVRDQKNYYNRRDALAGLAGLLALGGLGGAVAAGRRESGNTSPASAAPRSQHGNLAHAMRNIRSGNLTLTPQSSNRTYYDPLNLIDMSEHYDPLGLVNFSRNWNPLRGQFGG